MFRLHPKEEGRPVGSQKVKGQNYTSVSVLCKEAFASRCSITHPPPSLPVHNMPQVSLENIEVRT